MSIVGLNCNRGYVKFEDCLSCTQRCIIEQTVHKQLEKMHGGPNDSDDGYYVHRDDEYHVTSLLGCPRRLVLARMAGDFIRPRSLWRITVGVLGHSMMEDYPCAPGRVEELVTRDYDIDGVQCRVVGKFDLFNTSTKHICDYKFVWGTRFIPNEKHYQQMACYELLARATYDTPQFAVGGQIIYVLVQEEGRRVVYIKDGEKFNNLVGHMSDKVPEMLRHYITAARDNILPAGDESAKECNYCSQEFKKYCDVGKNRTEKQSYYDTDTILAGIREFRHAATRSRQED